jgi:hypothetical protein
MPCEVFTDFSGNEAFDEAPKAIPASSRRSTMVQSRKSSLQQLPQAAMPPQQISMMFESRRLQGLTPGERTKVLSHLANILTLAAGIAIEEDGDELR